MCDTCKEKTKTSPIPCSGCRGLGGWSEPGIGPVQCPICDGSGVEPGIRVCLTCGSVEKREVGQESVSRVS